MNDDRPAQHALFNQLIDYAGLFPPAKLPLAEAVANYGRYRQGPERRLLGRFIIPADRLAELSALAGARFRPPDPWRFSILGSGGETAAAFLTAVGADLAALAAFRQAHGRGVAAEAYEARLPAGVGGPALADLLAQAGAALAAAGLRPFYEVGHDEGWAQRVQAAARAIGADNRASGRPASLKLRCGGADPAATPTPEELAEALLAGVEAGVPMKATAGLHHPLRHWDPALGGSRHGSANLFAAAILARARRPGLETVVAILADEDGSHFRLEEDGLAWGRLRATVAEVAAGRREAMRSYGSCDFEEPAADLRALGWL
jgi:hypothetical protein